MPLMALGDREPQQPQEKPQQEKGSLPILPAFKNYLWGKPWDSSLVARLCEQMQDFELSRGLNYAEMWMGTHPSGPSRVRLEGLDGVGHTKAGLKETIARRPQFWLGRDMQRGDLPFMLKVLSIEHSTPIQVHPDRQRAMSLHRSNPDTYQDDTARHELCLPLGEYEGLVGFRPEEEIRSNLANVRELQLLLGDSAKGSLKDVFGALMRSDPEDVRHQVASMVRRIGLLTPEEQSPEDKLALRLQASFAGDVGIFCVYFLNYVHIAADMRRRYIFCPALEPHCHISGDCIACVSLSDNAVHAALTPQIKDTETFLEMLSYRHGLLNELVGTGEMMSKRVVKYNTPVDDFLVYEVEGGNSGTSHADPALDLPRASVCLCHRGAFSVSLSVNGPVEDIRQGQCFLLRAGSCLSVLRSERGARLFIASY